MNAQYATLQRQKIYYTIYALITFFISAYQNTIEKFWFVRAHYKIIFFYIKSYLTHFVGTIFIVFIIIFNEKNDLQKSLKVNFCVAH